MNAFNIEFQLLNFNISFSLFSLFIQYLYVLCFIHGTFLFSCLFLISVLFVCLLVSSIHPILHLFFLHSLISSCLFSFRVAQSLFMRIIQMYYLKFVGALVFQTMALSTSEIINPFIYGLYSIHTLTEFFLCCCS